MESLEISGACTCGQLRFSSKQPPKIQAICHCTDCRKATGSAFTETAFFSSSALTISGKVFVQEFLASSGATTTRESCPECKCVMFDRSEGVPSLIGVITQYISPPFEAKPVCHMWVRSKLPRITINDDLVQYEQRIQF